MRTLNGRPILTICATCAIKHAVIAEPQVVPDGFPGLCDICEVIGPTNAAQTVFDVKQFGGVRRESYHNRELLVFENSSEG